MFKKRVAVAAAILSRIHQSELDFDTNKLIESIIKQATRYPPSVDKAGNILIDNFSETARRSTKKTAQKIAEKNL